MNETNEKESVHYALPLRIHINNIIENKIRKRVFFDQKRNTIDRKCGIIFENNCIDNYLKKYTALKINMTALKYRLQ